MSGIPFPAKFKAVITDLLGITAKGQATMANSLPVALASNQSALPVTDNSGSLTTDTAQLPGSLGQANMAGSVSVAIASNQSAVPIADGGSSITVDNTSLGAPADAAVTNPASSASIPASLKGLLDGLGDKTMNFSSGGAGNTLIERVGGINSFTQSIDDNLGGSTDVAVTNGANGSLIAQTKNISAVVEDILTATNGTQTATEAVQAVLEDARNRQPAGDSLSTVRAASGATLRYNATNADGVAVDPVLATKNSNVINTATAGATGNFGFAYWSGGPSDDVHYFIPMRNYNRLTFVLTNNLDRTVDVTVYGYIQRDGTTTQHEAILATAYSGISGGASLIVGTETAETGGSADYKQIRSLCKWDYIGLKVEVVSSAPTSGDVQLLVSRDL